MIPEGTVLSAPQIPGPAAVPLAHAAERANPPKVEQQQRFVRRLGAEVVVSVADKKVGRLANPADVLSTVPGIFVTERGAGSSAFMSMRGSDIATYGSCNGRGIRDYVDGFPLGWSEAGLTTKLVDISSANYAEVYRGGNSPRYGAIAAGGALNFVSKMGLSAPETAITISGGSFCSIQT